MPPLTKPQQAVDVLRPASPDAVLKLIRKGVTPQDAYMKFLLTGEWGVGKTFFCATAENALLAITETNVSLGTLAYAQEMLGREIVYAPITSASEMDGLLMLLEQQAREGKLEYEVFVVDSLTAYCRMVGNEIAGGEMVMSLEDISEDRNYKFYQALDVHMRQFLDRLRNLPMHVVCTALPREDKTSTVAAVYPAQLRKELGSYFNLAGYLDRVTPLGEDVSNQEDGPPRVIYFDKAGFGTKNAGARKMPARLINPTFEDIKKIWMGGAVNNA